MPVDRFTGARIPTIEHVPQCIRNILQTPTGTRPMELDFGTNLVEIADLSLNDDGRARIAATTAGAVTAFETRPVVERVTTDPSADGSVIVTLYWSLDGESVETASEL